MVKSLSCWRYPIHFIYIWQSLKCIETNCLHLIISSHVHKSYKFYNVLNDLLAIKVVCSHCILIPQDSTGSSTLCCQMKVHVFLIITPKFQLQIHYTLVVIAESVPISGIPILVFLYIFITASFPMSHSYFCPRREEATLR